MKKITLAGGCFWGVEAWFKLQPGVTTTKVGYANGHKDKPTYEEVCRHATGHAEACLIEYDETITSITSLLDAFWKVVDPTLLNRQGNDIGDQYRTGIYYTEASELEEIKASVAKEQKNYKAPIVTEITPLTRFWDAETYHQDYLDKNPGGYCHIPLNQLKKDL